MLTFCNNIFSLLEFLLHSNDFSFYHCVYITSLHFKTSKQILVSLIKLSWKHEYVTNSVILIIHLHYCLNYKFTKTHVRSSHKFVDGFLTLYKYGSGQSVSQETYSYKFQCLNYKFPSWDVWERGRAKCAGRLGEKRKEYKRTTGEGNSGNI